MEDIPNIRKSPERKSLSVLMIIGVFTFIIWQFPEGKLFLYPFTLLGTWFHEMGHGLAAIALGGTFLKLEIYANGSGIAFHTSDLYLGDVGRAIVAASGPLCPTIAGGLFIAASKKVNLSRLMLLFLGGFMIISDLLWVRSLIGFFLLIIFGGLFLLISIFASGRMQQFTLQFLAIQAFLSLYLSIGYLLSPGGEINGQRFLSDTEVISESLFLPFWFWGVVCILFSVLIIILSIVSYMNDNKEQGRV